MDQLFHDIGTHLSKARVLEGTGHALNQGADHGLIERSGIDRRQERREWCLEPCTYELIEQAHDFAGSSPRGEAYTVNQSVEGMMLLMPHAPSPMQYLEVHTTQSPWRYAMSICEVKWTRPIHIESRGDFFMVGCHRAHGPCKYVQF